MSDLNEQFDRIAAAYESSQGGPVAGQKKRRKLYGLYKQATEGDAHGPQPGFFNFEEQNKFRAWKKLAGTSRREAQQKFVELARQLGYRDPGDSPVEWISEETWRREESWVSPDFDDQIPCVNTPELVHVGDALRDIAPTVGSASHEPVPPPADDDEHLRRLEDAPKTRAFHLYSPKWPTCCERLTVLVGYRGVDDVFADVLPEAHRIDKEETEPGWKELLETSEPDPYGEETLRDGLLLFHCRNCGGVYISSHMVGG